MGGRRGPRAPRPSRGAPAAVSWPGRALPLRRPPPAPCRAHQQLRLTNRMLRAEPCERRPSALPAHLYNVRDKWVVLEPAAPERRPEHVPKRHPLARAQQAGVLGWDPGRAGVSGGEGAARRGSQGEGRRAGRRGAGAAAFGRAPFDGAAAARDGKQAALDAGTLASDAGSWPQRRLGSASLVTRRARMQHLRRACPHAAGRAAAATAHL